MASRTTASLILVALAVVSGAAAQAPAPLRLSFAEAVRRAAGTAPVVELAGLRSDEAQARVRQARATLLPNLTATAAWVNRDFNKNSLGIKLSFPGAGLPTLIRPFNTYDSRLQVTQTLVDFSSVGRVRAARAQAAGARAEGGAASEASAGATALAYLRAARADAVVGARQADSTIAAELVILAEAQRRAGVSAAIDVTRARTQLVVAAGALVVARNQRDRARIDLARALGIDPATPLALTDTLTARLGAADAPATPDSAIALAVARRPDLAAEAARAEAARRSAAAITAERLPRVGLEADYGSNGPTVGSSIGTGQIAVQVTLPILDGFRREGRAAEQQAVVHESDVRTRDLKQQIAADVTGAFLDLGAAGAQQTIAAERLRLAQDELAQARERFKAGVAGNIEVIDAQASLIRARDTDIDARFAAAAARVNLARAVGLARDLH